MFAGLAHYIFYYLWDIKDRSIKLKSLRELSKSQWLPENESKKRQWIKVLSILNYAYKNCRYYRDLFDSCNITPSKNLKRSEFEKIPILSKKDIKDNLEKLKSDKYSWDSLVPAKTGGSTGTALQIYFNKTCQEMRNAAAFRADMWANWNLGDKKAAIWGNPPAINTWKKRIRNLLLDRIIYLDTMKMDAHSMGYFVELLRKSKPKIIFGHSHSIFILAKFLQAHRCKDICPRGIISTSMMLLPHERSLIEEVFQCKVTDRYGCEEVGLIACECEAHNGMHLNIDHLFIEFIKEDGSQAGPGEKGSIVVTDLINTGMPLIRYKIEDIGVPTDRKCACGRGLPLMEKVAGRVADFLIREDGSLVAGVSLIERTLTAIKGIEQMQIIQDEIQKIKVNLVVNRGFDKKSEKALHTEFQNVFGLTVSLELSFLDSIPQEESGKYRFSICNIESAYV